MCSAIDYDISFATIVPLIRLAGFKVLSLGAVPAHTGFDTAEGRARIRKLVEDENSLQIDSVHSSPAAWWLFSADEARHEEAFRQCKVAIDAASDLGVDIAVIHAGNENDGDRQEWVIRRGIEKIDALCDYALGKRVWMAMENVLRDNPPSLLDMIFARCPGEPVGFCYDSGHARLTGDDFALLERYGHRLLTTHIQDNRGGADDHLLPYEGIIDWEQFARIFGRLSYSRNLLLEPMTLRSAFKDPAEFLAEGLKRANRLIQASNKG